MSRARAIRYEPDIEKAQQSGLMVGRWYPKKGGYKLTRRPGVESRLSHEQHLEIWACYSEMRRLRRRVKSIKAALLVATGVSLSTLDTIGNRNRPKRFRTRHVAEQAVLGESPFKLADGVRCLTTADACA